MEALEIMLVPALLIELAKKLQNIKPDNVKTGYSRPSPLIFAIREMR